VTDVQRDLGRLETQLDEQDKRLGRFEEKLDSIGLQLGELTASANRVRGAWGLILGAGAVMTAIVEGARALLGK
jgi:hypothetical protein